MRGWHEELLEGVLAGPDEARAAVARHAELTRSARGQRMTPTGGDMTTDTSRMPYQLPFPPEAADEAAVFASPFRRTSGSGSRRPRALWTSARCSLLHAGRATGATCCGSGGRGSSSRHRHPDAGPRATSSRVAGTTRTTTPTRPAQPGGVPVRAAGRDAHPRRAGGGEYGDYHENNVNGGDDLRRPVGVRTTGYEDVFTKIDMCRKHYEEVGLGGRLHGPVHPIVPLRLRRAPGSRHGRDERDRARRRARVRRGRRAGHGDRAGRRGHPGGGRRRPRGGRRHRAGRRRGSDRRPRPPGCGRVLRG